MSQQLLTSIFVGYTGFMLFLHFFIYAIVKRNVKKGEKHRFTSFNEAFTKTKKSKEMLQTYYVYALFSMFAMLVAAVIHIAIENSVSLFDHINLACVYVYALVLWLSYIPHYYSRISTLHRIYLHERLEQAIEAPVEENVPVPAPTRRARKSKIHPLTVAKEN